MVHAETAHSLGDVFDIGFLFALDLWTPIMEINGVVVGGLVHAGELVEDALDHVGLDGPPEGVDRGERQDFLFPVPACAP